MINDLMKLLGEGESVKVTLQGAKDGDVRMVIQPMLSAEPEGISDELKSIRAALATPLIVTGSPDELETELPVALRETAIERDEARVSFSSAVSAYKSASKAASNVKPAGKEGAQEKDKPEDEVPAEESADKAGGSDSVDLFK